MSTIISDDNALDADPLVPLLAARLKREREARGLSLAELAAASGVSRAMISKIERGAASPTATLLNRLSGAFGLTISSLLARAEADGAVGRLLRSAEQEEWKDPESGYIRRPLSPTGADPELVLVELPPDTRVPCPAASYSFLRGQCVWVISGRLVIQEGDERTTLGNGDCLAFDLTSPRDCAFENPSANRAVRYVVVLARK